MYHYLQPVQNLAGDALPGYFVQATTAANVIVTMASDVGGTPIITTSGVANMAMVDANGMVSFYVADGNYTLNVYAPDGVTLKSTFKDVPMVTSLSLAVGAVTALGAGATPTASINSGVSPALLNLGLPAGAQGIQGITGAAGANSGTGANSSSRTAMAAITSQTAGTPVVLTESGRSGIFVWSAANLSAQVTIDTLQGIYVPPASDTTGASGAWVRQVSGACRAEWWGAVPNNISADCLAAISAALNVHGNVELDAADYYISAMLVHAKEGTRLAGKGCFYNGVTGQGTRLLVIGGTATCVQVGPTVQPGTINSFPQGIVLEDIHVARTVAPAKGTTAASVRVQFTLNSRLTRVRGAESIYGIHLTGNANLNVVDCYAARASAGTGGAADQYRGLYIDGTASIGAVGGNASIWVRRFNASSGLAIADSTCIYIDSKYTDCFLINPETTSGSYGIYVAGLGTTTTATANRDLIILHPVCDQHTVAPIRISAVNRSGSVEIISPYAGPGPAATAGIYIESCPGGVTVRGGQIDMSAAAGVPGILIAASNGTVVDGPIIHDFTGNGVAASGSGNLILKPNLENFNVATTGAGVQLSACNRATVAPMIRGAAASVATGVQLLGSANTKVDVVVTNIDPAAASLIATINAVTISARGDYTSAGATSGAGTINAAGQF